MKDDIVVKTATIERLSQLEAQNNSSSSSSWSLGTVRLILNAQAAYGV